jgi:magnesium chelatase family protein
MGGFVGVPEQNSKERDSVNIMRRGGCPCGFFGDATRECRCTPGIIQRYLSKISGPLLDRIDIHIEVPAVPYKELRGNGVCESSADMRAG